MKTNKLTTSSTAQQPLFPLPTPLTALGPAPLVRPLEDALAPVDEAHRGPALRLRDSDRFVSSFVPFDFKFFVLSSPPAAAPAAPQALVPRRAAETLFRIRLGADEARWAPAPGGFT